MSLRLVKSASQQTNRLALPLIIRSFSTTRSAGQDYDSRTIQERYIEACRRAAKLEAEWHAQRKASSERSTDDSVFDHAAPFGWRSGSQKQNQERSEPNDPNVWAEARQKADRHSKYAWLSAEILRRNHLMRQCALVTGRL